MQGKTGHPLGCPGLRVSGGCVCAGLGARLLMTSAALMSAQPSSIGTVTV